MISSAATWSVCVQGYSVPIPRTTGRNSTAISGMVRLAASKMRRKTPHDPPDKCWIIIRPSDPIATPSHSRKATSQARKKWSRATTKPMAQTTRPAMPTCRARVRTASRSAGGV